MSRPVEHFNREHKVFSFIRIRNIQSLGGTILLAIVQVQLLHVLIGVADADEGAQLRGLLCLAFAQHLLLTQPPALPEQVDTGWRAEEPLLVAVRLLRHLGVQDDHDHVGAVAQVALHGLPREAALLGAVGSGPGPRGTGEARVQGSVLRRRRWRRLRHA